ncbi:hypothetical protein TH5_09210 [Thalassospira xianhensis MCCC 1A02616]|uniref:Uncharacterized protein n=1 Tax=Thalassospira xianhensis MCCC 1A02616 TaxID=1177929 RepID=A0A367UDG9_9PROT|nr:hypothetical protein TH5_09210 [Thalassospira xianhensis MCCC 1A02616]
MPHPPEMKIPETAQDSREYQQQKTYLPFERAYAERELYGGVGRRTKGSFDLEMRTRPDVEVMDLLEMGRLPGAEETHEYLRLAEIKVFYSRRDAANSSYAPKSLLQRCASLE